MEANLGARSGVPKCLFGSVQNSSFYVDQNQKYI